MTDDNDNKPEVEIIPPIPRAKQIVELGRNTRFSSENQPKRKNKWAVRKACKRLAACELNLVPGKGGKEQFEKLDETKLADMMGQGKRALTIAELIAARLARDALAGNTKAQEQFTNNVEGKLINKVVEAKATLEDLLLGKTEDDDDEED